jgi:ABC-type sugar transport system ATPase subunit
MYAAHSIRKRYGATEALSDVDFTAAAGEVHALLGMNGAGKSTLVKILVGVEEPDSGTLSLDGEQVPMASLRDAFGKGIAVVAQDLNVFGELTVLANLFLLREPRRYGLLDLTTMRSRAQDTLRTVGLDLDPRTKVSALSQSDKQRVAIARAVLFKPKVLLLDEPTSALQPREKETLLQVVRRLRDSGTAIVYVSHFLEEVFSIADRVTVLRDGHATVRGIPIGETSLSETVRSMSGKRTNSVSSRTEAPRSLAWSVSDTLTVESLSRAGDFHDVSLQARGGEILGVAGLEGSGARSLLASIFGAARADTGTVTLPNGKQGGRSIPASVSSGVALVPADRLQSGLMPEASIMDNLLQIRVATLGRAPLLLRRRPLMRRAQARVDQLGIKIGSLQDKLSSLSGGNQQKVLVGKWLEADAHTYLLDDPTAAVDVHARAEMHALIRDVAAAGHIVIVSSSDPLELLQLCSRIAVMHSGQLRAVLNTEGLSSHDLLETINTGRSPIHEMTAHATDEGLNYA